ncbi:hypothetical protein STA3757_34780 [Stanieria sp. NIES-3757]|nr:hypothetical protein STA3757_34780 [Stanieria sp. NIES-3757]
MRGRKTRKIAEAELSLDSFLDIIANIIGVLIFITLFVATQAMNQKEVTILAKSEQGENRSKNPRYIECREDGVVLYPSKEFVPQAQLQNPNSALQKLISQIQNNKDKEYLIVALRPSGIDVFNQVRNVVQGKGIDIGYEPLDSGWNLNVQGEVVNEKKKTSQN